jgi:RecB family endonuclease NucS
LLEDKNGKAVIVECKQNQPIVRDIQQLQHYLNKFKDEEGQEARGILVHGGARKLRAEVRQAAQKKPEVELVQFSVGVDFSRSE